ncbi:penicillin-insensitive murein endopeptidase [Massilia mucilaginosa]|nr:penicillin-insensitive murein endopeptidase [Massilia mucilaginosa]
MAITAPPIQDSRGFFMLPQAPQESGYYVYGTPGNGRGQYAHPGLLSAIFMVERQWAAINKNKFGIGNISLAGGPRFEGHGTHKSGLEVDVRPLRKDGEKAAVTRFSQDYDREATATLIGLFLALPSVQLVYFNDKAITGVRPMPSHDDHFHVLIKVPS